MLDCWSIVVLNMREPKLIAEIAKQLRKFHEVDILGSREPQLWIDISKFFAKASNLRFDDIEKQSMKLSPSKKFKVKSLSSRL
ncbi:putative ethanolamine kinase [Silene latifolia]|uniref:putative ethanolamine kinase n=1 Tax=Silene latifolia TaxID=37657 RepID=UPI003D779FBB